MNSKSHRILAFMFLSLVLSGLPAIAQNPAMSRRQAWQSTLRRLLPLLGHRNWILIVDSAYPLQNSSGLQTIETGATQDEVIRETLTMINDSIHVRPVIYMDAELPFVPERDVPGVTKYRNDLNSLLKGYAISTLPHEQLLQKVLDVSKSYDIIILKTNAVIPYSSVFVQLNCKYWSDDAESRLRKSMNSSPAKTE